MLTPVDIGKAAANITSGELTVGKDMQGLVDVTFGKLTPGKPVAEVEATVHFILSSFCLENLASPIDRSNSCKDHFCGDDTLTNAARTTISTVDGFPSTAAAGGGADSSEMHLQENGDHVCFRFEGQTLLHTLKSTLLPSKFEFWLDRIIATKTEFKRSLNLCTPFENTRMEARPQQVDELLRQEKKALMHQEKQSQKLLMRLRKKHEMEYTLEPGLREIPDGRMENQDKLTPRMCYERRLSDASLKQLLEKVFKAADEEKRGCLQHREVAGLLFACPLNLSRWEFIQLLCAAQEMPGGWIEYGPFLEKIPSLLNMLRARRAKAQQCQTKRKVTPDAVLQLYRDELEETFRVTRDLLEGAGSHVASTGRCTCNWLPSSCGESRYSKQDAAFVMQTIPGNDRGEVEYEALPTLLQVLRRESVNNAVLEVDEDSIEDELKKSASEMGLTPCGCIPIWTLRDVLDNSGLCLSKMHIHALLCLLSMNRLGQVEWNDFATVVRKILPPLFDSSRVLRSYTAERISKVAADAEAQAELEALQGLAGAKPNHRQKANYLARRRSKMRGHSQVQQVEDFEQGDAPDRESVEKALVHLFTVLDDRRKGLVPIQMFVGVMFYWFDKEFGGQCATEPGGPTPPASAMSMSGGAAFTAERRYADIVLSCRLSPQEVTGFVAEAKVDPHGQEIAYSEHIKAWIGTIFEMRRSPLWYNMIHNIHEDGVVHFD
ncbi:hypothetical protein Efla_000538 [Eimeria flavescens]